MAVKKARKAPAPVKKVAPLKSRQSTKKKTKVAGQNPAVNANSISVRMYCIGTGDCFIVKIFDMKAQPFTIMIDCGCCRGDEAWFTEYLQDLSGYIEQKLDLLIVTHEHLDHVNGFQKLPAIFEKLEIREAWFAWTEDPADPTGAAAELLKKKSKMKASLGNAIREVKVRGAGTPESLQDSFFAKELVAAQKSLVKGLDSLGEINLELNSTTGNELAGLKIIKEILKKKHVKTRYLGPGETVTIPGLAGIRFHVLGPPVSSEFIFKDGREGKDVFKKNMALNKSALAAKAFDGLTATGSYPEDLPFAKEFVVSDKPGADDTSTMVAYNQPGESWRTIDNDWLMSAGSLAIRLNSHINNSSLALAIESTESRKVVLLPGDAEYGSWESWQLIENWKNTGKDGKPFAEDLLGRTVFYKVAHHLSYNGTALEKGINMMKSGDLVAMATLDRNRISEGWKTTMPNKALVKELVRKTGGKFFIMDETGVENPPSKTLDPHKIAGKSYTEKRRSDDQAFLYKEFRMDF